MQRKLIYFCPEIQGGLADYAHAQAEAMANQGVEVIFLTRPGFSKTHADVSYRIIDALREEPENLSPNRWLRRIQHLRTLLKNMAILRGLILSLHVKEVVWNSFFEYGSPLWVGNFQDLIQSGVRMGVIVHDPVRDYQVGPAWWHRKSIQCASSLFQQFFYHGSLSQKIESWNVFSNPEVAQKAVSIPHGLYRFPEPTLSRDQMRLKLNLPLEAQVWLSFGHLRDGKNLELLIEALKDFPNDYLLVVGREQSSGQKPLHHYQEFARRSGVESRCRSVHEYVPESEVGNYFQASDIVVLTYSKDFRSSSGVLAHAVRFRRPVLASGGESRLVQEVGQYQLGEVIEADSLDAIKMSLRKGNLQKGNPAWDRYEQEHSWEVNAKRVLEKMKE